jgi:hypothetical protein
MTNRTYDVTLAASIGSSQRIEAAGSQVQVISAAGGSVGIKVDGGPEYTFQEGQGFMLEPGQMFRDVVVRNLTAHAQTVTLFIGTSGFIDRRVTGSVKIIDSSYDKTAAGAQFFVGGQSIAVAGQGSVVFLHGNGTTRKVAVRGAWLASSIAGNVTLGVGTGGGTIITGGGGATNKLIGGAVSTAFANAANSAAAVPTVGEITGRASLFFMPLVANQALYVPLPSPVVLTGTQCIYASGHALNRDISAAFDFEELTY